MNNLSEKNLAASKCLYGLVERQAILRSHAAAILAPGRAPLTYGRFLEHIGETASALSGAGLAGTVRVAVVLSDPAAQAVTMIAVASVATCVPFGPALTAREYRIGFSRTRVRAVVLESGSASPARVAAESLGLQLLEASPSPEGESGVCLLAGGRDGGSPLGYSGPEDTAFVLQTSGTTGLPKVIPIGQAAICASARLWVDGLQLSERDRCLNLMSPPTMGGISNLLPTLMAGASVIPGSGSWTPHFFRWLELFRPTWYAGSPPVHQAVLSLAATARPNAAPSGSLRFIRSGTAPLPPQVMLGLEACFLVPAIETYGLSEVSPVSINPFPPGKRKPGSVGLPVVSEVGVMADTRDLLPAGQVGQIVVRDGTVFRGYEGDPEANEAASVDGWFRTGDLGYVDAEGYLFVTGRVKEIINRGGDKVSPREVDEVLLDHPAVGEAVAFAVPDDVYGEDVAVAVVLRPGASASPAELRQFAAGRLAPYKVPRQVRIVDRIPLSPGGKVQRSVLARTLGPPARTRPPTTYIPPRTPVEKVLAAIWAEVINVETVGLDDGFPSLGGDSIHLVRVVARISDAFGVEFGLEAFLSATTVGAMASIVTQVLAQVGGGEEDSHG